MDSSGSSHHHLHYVLVSNGEDYVGHALAHHLVNELSRRPGRMKRKHWRVRVLCRDLQSCEDLLRMGADCREVDYSSVASLRRHMHHVKCVILVPDMTEQQLMNGRNVVEAAYLEGVKRMQMISDIALSYMMKEQKEDESRPLGQFHALEQCVREKYAYGRWCIFRLSMIHQVLYYWARMVEQKGCIGMPMPPDTNFVAIGIQDICDAVATLILGSHKQDQPEDNDEEQLEVEIPDAAVKRIFELTGVCVWMGETVAYQLGRALGAPEGEITYCELSPDELRQYFESITGQEQGGSNTLAWFGSLATRILGVPDRPGLIPDPHRHLKKFDVEFLLHWFEMAKRAGGFTRLTNDARDLIGREPRELNQFFEDNRQQFRRPSATSVPE